MSRHRRDRSCPTVTLLGIRQNLLPELFQDLVPAGVRERGLDIEDPRLSPFAGDFVLTRRLGDPTIDPVTYFLEARDFRRGCERADPLQRLGDALLHLRRFELGEELRSF